MLKRQFTSAFIQKSLLSAQLILLLLFAIVFRLKFREILFFLPGIVFNVICILNIHKFQQQLLVDIELIRSTNGEYQLPIKSYPADIAASLNKFAKYFKGNNDQIANYSQQLDGLLTQNENDIILSELYLKRFQNSGQAAFIYDAQGIIFDLNKQASYLLKIERDELLHSNFWDLLPESDKSNPRFAFRSAGDSGSLCYESHLLIKNKIEIPVEIRTTVIDSQNHIMQSNIFDISQRQKIQNALKASEDKFKSFIDAASDFLFMTNAEGEIVYANPAMLYALNFSEDDLPGRHLSEIMTLNTEIQFSEAYHDIIAKEDEPLPCEWKTNRGGILFGELNGFGYYDSQGEFVGFHGIFTDLTYKKRLLESQRLAQLGRLSADVAHDIKNQLTVLFSISEMSLMKGTTKDQLLEDMRTIQVECHRINDVVRRLLQFSRSGSGERKKCAITKEIDFVVKLLNKLFYQNVIKVKCKYDRILPDINIDKTQIKELFMNVLQNAVEAINQDGTITITAGIENEFVKIEVIDSGAGIPADLMEKIFDPFFTTKENGTGLGVSACYGIMKDHDGDLIYSSIEGEGTVVSIFFPISS